jgi:hypothetical protein
MQQKHAKTPEETKTLKHMTGVIAAALLRRDRAGDEP